MTSATPNVSADRDNFSGPTKDLLAKRSGYICAYPGCRRMTVAVSEDRRSGLTMPDGRTFFLPHTSLSFSEQQIAFLDIALRLASFRPRGEAILYVFDTSFFQRLDDETKVHLFRKITALDDGVSQTLFCVNDAEDAEILKDVQSDNWINAQRLGRLTLHNFL